MEIKDIETQLKNAKFKHLTDVELDSYQEQTLSKINQLRVEKHLELCLLCEKRFALIQEEKAAMLHPQITNEDRVLVRQIIKNLAQKPDSPKASFLTRLTEYLQQALADWQVNFMQPNPVRRAVPEGEEVWQWESKDKMFRGRAVFEKNNTLKIYFYSDEVEEEGTPFNIRLGTIQYETVLQRSSAQEIYAKVEVPLRKRPKNLADPRNQWPVIESDEH